LLDDQANHVGRRNDALRAGRPVAVRSRGEIHPGLRARARVSPRVRGDHGQRAASEPMLIWHLMTHTSGLTYDFYFNHPVDEMYRNAGFGTAAAADYTLEEACDRWAPIPLLFEPGTAWNYSVSTDVLGRVVEVASGQSLDQFFATRIFEPLGMRDTGFSISASDRSRLTRLYAPNPQTGLAVAAPDLERDPVEQPKMLSGGGGLV